MTQSVNDPTGRGATGRRSAAWLLLVPVVAGLVVVGTLLFDRYVEGETLTGDGRPRSLRILTWNIGKLYHTGWDSRASDRDLDHVADVIRRVDPHVVALQELTGPTQLGRLVSMLGRRWRARAPEDRYDRRAGLLVRLPARFMRLPTSTGRTAQGAVITTPGRGSIAVASVHLDAFDASRRLSQAEEILAGLQRLDPRSFILAGDLNFDASLAARGSPDNRLYRFLTQQMSDAGRYAGVTTVISRRLDYVFYRSARVTHTSAQVVRDMRINIMDHDPLLVELTLDPAR